MSDIHPRESPQTRDELLIRLFDELEGRGVQYVVLRDYGDLPQSAGDQFDVVVTDDHVDRFERTLTAIADESGWLVLRRAGGYATRSFACVSKEGQNLRVDAFSALTWRGIRWIDTAEILDRRRRHREGFYVPPPGAEAATLVLSDLLQSGEINPKCRARISELAARDECTFRRSIRPCFGDRVSRTVYERVARSEWDALETSQRRLRLTLLGSVLASPRTTMQMTLDYAKNRLREHLTVTKGAIICFIGPHGTGKTTLADEFDHLVRSDHVDVRRHHVHFNVLPKLESLTPDPIIDRLVDTDERESEHALDAPATFQTYSDGVANLRMWYYALDYVLGNARVVCPRAKGDVILFDRYFYDYLYDHVFKPSGMTADRLVFHVLRWLAPNPDVVVYLCADPSTIRDRKPELSVEQIRRQQRGCEEVIDAFPHIHRIDAEGEVDEVVRAVFDVVAREMMD